MISKYDLCLFGIGALITKGTILQIFGFPALPVSAIIAYLIFAYSVFVNPPV